MSGKMPDSQIKMPVARASCPLFGAICQSISFFRQNLLNIVILSTGTQLLDKITEQIIKFK